VETSSLHATRSLLLQDTGDSAEMIQKLVLALSQDTGGSVETISLIGF